MPKRDDEVQDDPVAAAPDAPASAPLAKATAAPPSPAAPAAPVDPTVVQAEAAAKVLGDPAEPFVIKDWCGFPNYCCRYCDNAILDDKLGAYQHYLVWHQFKTQTGEVTKQRRSLSVDEYEALKVALKES